jgi:formate dehydrogenase alpha subunit
MMASHPDSCMVCDKGNRCDLRRIAADLGIGLVKYDRILQPITMQEVNPFFERDLSKCILCAQCIRSDQELVVVGALDYIHRGFNAKPATFNDMPLENSECTFCGTCIAFCPTGALIEKDRLHRVTTTTSIPTTCALCGCGCSIYIEFKDNQVVRVIPSKTGVNHGTICVRGSYGYDFIHSSERLTKPLINVNGSFKEVSWEQALGEVASELGRIKQVHGPGGLAVLGSSKCTNEENYLLQRFARGILGTNNIDNSSSLYNTASRIGLGRTLDLPVTTSLLDDLEHSDVILVIGANPTSSAPIVGYTIKRAVRYKGARLLLIDPLQTNLASFAQIWLRPKIGTDLALLNGMARVIIADGLLNEASVTRMIDTFTALRQSLEIFTPEYFAEESGVSSQELRHTARLFAEANRSSIVYGNGITQHARGIDSVTALANLAMLTGNIGYEGTGIYAIQRDNNGQGACDMGALPDYLPGYQSINDAKVRKNFIEQLEIEIPTDTGLTGLEMIEQAKAGKIKGMYIMGENPALGFPHLSLVNNALANLDFLVVQDMFLTETAKLATVVLPASSFVEKEGTFTNFEGRVQPVRQAIQPPGDSLSDLMIIIQLAKIMGQPMPFSSPGEVMDEIRKVVPLYEAIADTGLLGTRQIHKNHGASEFGRFFPVQYVPQTEPSKDTYPLVLLTGSIPYQFGNGSRSSRTQRLQKFQHDAFVEVSHVDAQRLGIDHDNEVKVVSPTGELITTARLNSTLPEGILFIPISFPTSPVNKLFSITPSSQTNGPSLKSCSVSLERMDSGERTAKKY